MPKKEEKKAEAPVEKPWYLTGEEAEEFQEDIDEKRAANQDKVFRFWMPPKTSGHITFVDNPVHPSGFKLPFAYLEHNPFLNGSYKNWFTCPGEDSCPLCKAGNRPALVAAYTIIDHSEWDDRSGKHHKDEVKLYIVKSKVLKVLRKAATKKGSLRGWFVEVSRTDDLSPNTGDQFDFEKQVELPTTIQPFDYPTILAPKSLDELSELVADLKTDGEPSVRF